MGYYQAGFEVVGVDIEPQPNYPFEFHQADALEYLAAHWQEFDGFGASPPCQFASEATPMQYRGNHPNLIPATRKALQTTGKPYSIENVENARRWLINPVLLCGTMFGLPIWRHRYFEVSPPLLLSPMTCQHVGHPISINPGSNARRNQGSHSADTERWAMGIDWMTQDELTEAIPPAYTKWIGMQLLTVLLENVHA